MAKNFIGIGGSSIRAEKHLKNFEKHGKRMEIWRFKSKFEGMEHIDNYGVACEGVWLSCWAKSAEEVMTWAHHRYSYRLSDKYMADEMQKRAEIALTKLTKEELDDYISQAKEARKCGA